MEPDNQTNCQGLLNTVIQEIASKIIDKQLIQAQIERNVFIKVNQIRQKGKLPPIGANQVENYQGDQEDLNNLKQSSEQELKTYKNQTEQASHNQEDRLNIMLRKIENNIYKKNLLQQSILNKTERVLKCHEEVKEEIKNTLQEIQMYEEIKNKLKNLNATRSNFVFKRQSQLISENQFPQQYQEKQEDKDNSNDDFGGELNQKSQTSSQSNNNRNSTRSAFYYNYQSQNQQNPQSPRNSPIKHLSGQKHDNTVRQNKGISFDFQKHRKFTRER